MESMKLERIGENCWGHIVYKDKKSGKFYLDINNGKYDELDLRDCHPSDDPDGEPGWPVKKPFEIVNPITDREKREKEFEFEYMLLSRLDSDCRGFLSEGDCRFHNERNIWGTTIESHIAKMKELWQRFPEDLKPEWCSWEQILDYEKKMCEV